MDERKTITAIENVLNVMADVSVQNERINGWIPSSATNVILNWPERIKTQPHDERDNCFQHFDSKGPCGMTVNNDTDDDSATKHGDSHNQRATSWITTMSSLVEAMARAPETRSECPPYTLTPCRSNKFSPKRRSIPHSQSMWVF